MLGDTVVRRFGALLARHAGGISVASPALEGVLPTRELEVYVR